MQKIYKYKSLYILISILLSHSYLYATNETSSQLKENSDTCVVEGIPIFKVKPTIQAKIGSDDGVIDGKRYNVYECVTTDDNKVKTKRRGVVSATYVDFNRYYIREDDKMMTMFRQIAGNKPIKDEYILKPARYIGINLSLGYHSIDYFEGTLSLSKMAINGTMLYGLTNMSGRTYKLDEGIKCSAFRFEVGSGYGWHFARRFEWICFLKFGGEILNEYDPEDKSNYKLYEKGSIVNNIGTRFSANIYYPIQLFIQGNYRYPFISGGKYKSTLEKLENSGYSSRHGFAFSAGLTFNL